MGAIKNLVDTLETPRIAAAVYVRASAAYLHGVGASGQRSLAVAIYAPLPGEVYSSSTLKGTRGLSRASRPLTRAPRIALHALVHLIAIFNYS